jgi:Holliday junction resolvasome RuvABC DNA-binding subunit
MAAWSRRTRRGCEPKAFQALRGLGFRETEVKRALEQVMTHAGAGLELEAVLRKSLAVLTP